MSSKPPPQPTVLVADDDDDCLQLLSSMVRRLGFEVLEARNGRELCEQAAERYAAGRNLAAIVTDVGMPVCTGVTAAKWIGALTPEVPVILVTAYRGTALWEEAAAAGVRRILPKPFTAEQLTETLKAVQQKTTSV
ncbi:MAG: response regulator [Myxococcales bacterium]